MEDEGALQKAYGELEKWQNQYQKLMQQKNGFINTSYWQLVSKIPRTIEDAYFENASSNDEDLMSSFSSNTAEFCGNNNYSNARFTENSYSGNSFSSELLEEFCNTELSRNICRTDTVIKQTCIKRERTKHGKRLLAVNPYLNFLKRLEEPENYKIKREQFQQEVSELSSRGCNVPTISKERKKMSYDHVKPVVTDEETTLKFLFDKRKPPFNRNLISFKRGQLNLPERSDKTVQPSNQLAAHFLNVKPQSKYRVAWYTDCKEWFKPRLKDSLSEYYIH